MRKLFAIILLILIPFSAQADCVYGAKSKTKFQILDNHTLLLTGGYGNGSDIVIKTWCTINRFSTVSVLQDSFCSHTGSVLYIDNTVCDVRQVTKIN